MKVILRVVTVMLLSSTGIARRALTHVEEFDCHFSKCSDRDFNCNCESDDWRNLEPQCIPFPWICDAHQDCADGSDEIECTCPPGSFQCGSDRGGAASSVIDIYNCINVSRVGDGARDCQSFKDEILSLPSEFRCDGLAHDSRAEDERNCSSCPSHFPNRCACNDPNDFTCSGRGFTCYSDHHRCDGEYHCTDRSDEDGCSCRDDEFTCSCKGTNPPCIGRPCIPHRLYHDGREDCSDGSDEREYLLSTKCADCDVKVRRFDNIERCSLYPDCDNKTCTLVPALICNLQVDLREFCSESNAICTSYCTSNTTDRCNVLFQCDDGTLQIASNFCDAKRDCVDGSDETRIGAGFKCFGKHGTCILPQRNLFDDVAQCEDGSDLCWVSSANCFECFDGRLTISANQVCDGINDCYDLSDECLCQSNFHKPVCVDIFSLNVPSQLRCGKLNTQLQNFTVTATQIVQRHNRTFSFKNRESYFCHSKHGLVTAAMCDGRPECKDLSDECSCEDPPSFCQDECHNFYPLGDRYCNGIIDEAWKFINDSSCPEGFDEKSCPQRFLCKAGNLVSIDRSQVCDGRDDCDDGSDEASCIRAIFQSVFSSALEMIQSVALRSIFWIMAFVVIIGNSLVIYTTVRLLYKENMSEVLKMNHILILNLSLSDFLMGIYLLIISIKSVQFSGYYHTIDFYWRSSLFCSILGSIAIISSETSCFIMVIITAFHLSNTFYPFKSCTTSTLMWKLWIVLAWLISLLIGLIPLSRGTSNYFAHGVWFSNQFTTSEAWSKAEVLNFACRLATLSNQTIDANGNVWESSRAFLDEKFPDYAPLGEFGYYSETSVCLPRIYVSVGDHAWLYSLLIISFNFVAFVFIAVGYSLVLFKSSQRSNQAADVDVQNVRKQKHIARLIVTDFVCWIPICIMVYLRTGGVELSNVVYLVTAAILLPINSALNPFLYSSLGEKLFGKSFCGRNKINQNEETRMSVIQ